MPICKTNLSSEEFVNPIFNTKLVCDPSLMYKNNLKKVSTFGIHVEKKNFPKNGTKEGGIKPSYQVPDTQAPTSFYPSLQTLTLSSLQPFSII
jgi:hypothetical protein